MITSDDILGKKAVDSEGEILGIVIKLHIDNKEIIGVTVDQGFMKPDMFVGIEYVKFFGIDAVLLNQFPSEKLKGRKVFDSKGKFLGKVLSVSSQGGKLSSLTYGSMFKKQEASLGHIKELGTSVILKTSP